MYDHNLHRGRKHFCRCCLQTFSIEEMLKRHIKDPLRKICENTVFSDPYSPI